MAIDPMQAFQAGQKMGKDKQSSLGRTSDYMSDLFKERDKSDTKVNPIELAVLKQSLVAPEKQKDRDLKAQEFGDKQGDSNWKLISTKSDPNQSSRSGVGMANVAKLKTARIKSILNQPTVTPQMLGALNEDMGSIYAQGAPTDVGTDRVAYDTASQKVSKLGQFISGLPQGNLSKEMRDYIRNQVDDIDKDSNDMIKNHFSYWESAYPDVISKHSQEWNMMKQSAGLGQNQNPLQTGINNSSNNNLSSKYQEGYESKSGYVKKNGKWYKKNG